MAGTGVLVRLLERQRGRLAKNPDINRVIPLLIKKRFFSIMEEKQIANATNNSGRTDILIDKLSRDPEAVLGFCKALEECAPHLLTELLLDHGGNFSDSSYNNDTHTLQVGYELAMKERDAAIRENSRIADDLNDARRKVDALQAERNRLVNNLENLSSRLDKPTNPKRFDGAGGKVSNSSLQHILADSDDGAVIEEAGDNIVWQLHHVSLQRVVNYGFGIAVSGGRDTPHFASGDPSIAISDVLKGGPAEGKLQLNDRIVSANGVSLENVSHATAIQVLKNCGDIVHLVVRRRVVMPATGEREVPLRITITKRNKKDEFGLVLGCHFFIQEILPDSLASQDGGLRRGDIVLKINNTPLEGLSLADVKKLLDRSRDKLQIIVSKPSPEERLHLQPPSMPSRVDEGYATFRQPSDREDVNIYRPSVRSEDDFYPDGLHSPNREQVPGDLYNLPQDGYLSDHEAGFRRHPEEEDVFARPPLDERYIGVRSDIRMEIRRVAFQKDKLKGLGLRLAGGNATGIFIASVQPGSAAEAEGLAEGDQILQANGLDIVGLTREEAVAHLTSLEGQVTLIVQYKKEDYDSIMASHEAGDSFYVRTHFNYSEREIGGEHNFKVGDIFHIKDTLFRGVGGSWLAIRVGPNGEELKKGTIPNKKKAEAIAAAQQAENEEKDAFQNKGRGGLFKRKSTRRAKSLGKDHWEDVIFTGEDEEAGLTTKFPPYERVVLRDPAFVRPVVLFGAIADVARDRLLTDFPDRFESPQMERGTDPDPRKAKSGIIRFGAIRDAMNKQKHCVLDVTPYHVDRLNYAQYYPIVVFLRGESKQSIKEVRSRWRGNSAANKNPKKLQEMNEKMESLYPHLFTGTITHTTTDAWFPRLMEMIESQQRRPIWMSEKKPEEDMNDDFMFPMPNRMSLAGAPDAEQDLAFPSDTFDASPMQKKRLVRSSSDPSINTTERVPGIPPYPAPPGYHNAKAVPYRSRDDSGWDDYHLPKHVQERSGDWQMHPDDRYYPHHHHDASWSPQQHSPQQLQPSHNTRSDIDVYATVTPRERRNRTQEGNHKGAYDQYDPHHERIVADDQYGPTHDRIAADDQYGPLRDRTASDDQYGLRHERVSADDLYRMQVSRPTVSSADGHLAPAPGSSEHKGYNDASSHDSDSYSRYVSSPANKHDDSKLRDKFGSLQVGGRDRNPAAHDPYRFTRSTANPVSRVQIDRAKLNDLTARYRREEKQQARSNKGGGPGSPPAQGIQKNERQEGHALVKKKEPPPIPAKTYAHKDRGADIEEVKARNYENSNRSYNYSEITFHRQHSAGELRYQQEHIPPQLQHNTSESPYEYISARSQPVSSGRDFRHQGAVRGDIPPPLPSSLSPEDYPGDFGVGGYDGSSSSRAFSNNVYMDHREIDRVRGGSSDTEREAPRLNQSGYTRPRTDDEQLRELQRSRQRLPSDSHMPNRAKSETRMDVQNSQRWNKYKSWDNEKEAQKTFDTYKRLITPGFYGSRKQMSKSHDELRDETSEHIGPESAQRWPSAFETYKRTLSGSNSQLIEDKETGGQGLETGFPSQEGDSQTIIATARGVFTSAGGILESRETGVSIVIPPGALPEGSQQEIYFKVCSGNSILPPLDKDKGETLLSPLVMCGPHGLQFQKPVELKLPHSASVNPKNWSFALKSSDSPSGQPTQWQNMALAGSEGVTQGRVSQTSVSVLVDHF
ncbi:tight junction protein ZO-1-like isoform X3 [Pomacea canaliculata]|uniref:tight junction protein ZO-1-like isoform X3 n=1 Tax=Pomacea canaliculata TaxID=400727 RepID=UPI000D7377FB|nr:tight junction protein ZO-1-like isoform X3 [Pomacea canaliculata]